MNAPEIEAILTDYGSVVDRIVGWYDANMAEQVAACTSIQQYDAIWTTVHEACHDAGVSMPDILHDQYVRGLDKFYEE